MRPNCLKKIGTSLLAMLFAAAPLFGATPKAGNKKTSATHRNSRFSHLRKVANWKHHGQQQISGDRAREIQEALIREHYLDGQPTGTWDTRTSDAMRRFQADQGWQSKVIPDSRALIKLGLGPSHENDLNPDLMGAKAVAPLRGADAPVSEIPQR